MKRSILAGIILVAAVLRLYNLSHVPPSPSLDEVSIGYNAYSILHTGKDEYGNALPLLLRAYDDYRPALYVYMTVPFVWIFGLSVIAVRLPSVILSMITLWAAYGIGRMIGKKYLSFDYLGEMVVAILALSPWHIYISRLGHESNLGLTLMALGLCFFLRAFIDGKKTSFITAAAFFGLSVHGYQSEKIIVPLVVMAGGVLFWKDVWKAKSQIVIAMVVGFVIVLPALVASISPEGLSRFRGSSAFSTDTLDAVAAKAAYTSARERGDRFGQVVHSRYITNASIFVHNYVSHFSPGWLFFGDDREAHKAPGMGLLYLWEWPLLLIGLWALWSSRIPRNILVFLISYLLIAPLPAAITTQAPHAMRAYTVIPVLQLIEALGIWFIVRSLRMKQLQVFAAVVGIFVASGMSLFWRGYFVRFPAEQSDSFQFAMSSAISYAVSVTDRYERIDMANRGALYQSYMFFLYYTRFDPETYLSLGGTISGGYDATHRIRTYSFGFLPDRAENLDDGTLYFYDANDAPTGVDIVKRFTNADGKLAIVAVRKHP